MDKIMMHLEKIRMLKMMDKIITGLDKIRMDIKMNRKLIHLVRKMQ
jgi:hypothetical protein